jgi:hypothetical protein
MTKSAVAVKQVGSSTPDRGISTTPCGSSLRRDDTDVDAHHDYHVTHGVGGAYNSQGCGGD